MSEYVRQELLDTWIVAHDKQKARAEAAERKVARVEMLRDNWLELGTKSTVYESAGELAEILTAALADEEATDE